MSLSTFTPAEAVRASAPERSVLDGSVLAIGAGEKRPYVVNDELTVATVMSATGSFDHRAIDGADRASGRVSPPGRPRSRLRPPAHPAQWWA